MKKFLATIATECLAWYLIRVSRQSMAAHEAALWYRRHDLGYEYLQAWQRYTERHRAYRRWLPLYTRLREIEKCD